MNYHDPYESTPSSNNGEASDTTPDITSEGRWLSEVQQVLDSRLADAEELGWSDEQTEEVLGADVATVAYIEAQIREGNAAWTARLREYEVAVKDAPDATAVRSHQLDELVTYVRAAQEEARDGMKAHSTSPGERETAGGW